MWPRKMKSQNHSIILTDDRSEASK